MKVVVKIGSNILASDSGGLVMERVGSIAKDVAGFVNQGHKAVLVSSGAVAAGTVRLGLKKRPSEVRLKQAAASIGQPALMRAYEMEFEKHGLKVAQVLLTRKDLSDRTRYINAKNTIDTLFSFGVIPIVNENDTVATEEIKFGDNDQLAALIAMVSGAERLIILSDVEGLFTADPKRPESGAQLVETVEEITSEVEALAGLSQSAFGTGGMRSKVLAAKKAMDAGVSVSIISGTARGMLQNALAGQRAGTEFIPVHGGLTARKHWLQYGIKSKGRLIIDEGAASALSKGGKSLLPSGVVGVEGEFELGDAAYCVTKDGCKVAKGLVNYSSDETRLIMGRKTTEIEAALGYKNTDELVHRDNMVVLG